jgi:hypothetical protein
VPVGLLVAISNRPAAAATVPGDGQEDGQEDCPVADTSLRGVGGEWAADAHVSLGGLAVSPIVG